MTNIAISSGHGKYVPGAVDILDEHKEAVRVVDKVAEFLKSSGTGVKTFEDTTSKTQNENLNTIVNWHNKQSRDLDVSVHFNCYEHTSKPMGTECLYVTQADLADDVAEAMAKSGGFIDRGPKKRTDLYFLNNTSKPAILLEVCFVDSTADVDLYNKNFDSLCGAIAQSISGQDVAPIPPQPPERVPVSQRPTLRQGDEGSDVLDMQRMIPNFSGEFDGDFGPTTLDNVMRYQRTRGLGTDGICGPETWQALYDHKLPVPPPPRPPSALTAEQEAAITRIANESKIADYNWKDRGVAPTGYTQGMALSFGQSYLRLQGEHPAAVEMAKARTSSDKDVLNLWRAQFDALHMSNERAGDDVLRHLYAFMLGSGMRESSGQYCCGRDQSASNVTSDTCEAGAFQTSYNASNATKPEFDDLMDEYLDGRSIGYIDAWSEGVSCSAADWQNYGSGRGAEFQRLCKEQPAFSAETHALTLRNLCNHYGPVIRFEVELRADAEQMFQAVQDYMDSVA